MASQFEITFTRWMPAQGKRQQSAPTTTFAETFREAFEKADLMLIGMRCADPINTYGVAMVRHVGLIGETLNGHGGHIWSHVDLASLEN